DHLSTITYPVGPFGPNGRTVFQINTSIGTKLKTSARVFSHTILKTDVFYSAIRTEPVLAERLHITRCDTIFPFTIFRPRAKIYVISRAFSLFEYIIR